VKEIVKLIESLGVEVLISADPCYGACDIANEELALLNADVIVHFGHTGFPEYQDDKIIYIEMRSNLPIKDALKDSLRYLKKFKKIGLAATVQHIHNLSEASSFLQEYGKTPLIGIAANRVLYDGQILGCDFSTVLSIASHVQAFVIISGGVFHGMGVHLATGKPTIVVDPYIGKSKIMKEYTDKVLQWRRSAEKKFLEAKNIGIIVGLKKGQMRKSDSEILSQRLKRLGKETVIFCAREVKPDYINNFSEFDAHINTACPRITIDERRLFQKPMLNYDEAILLLNNLEKNLEEKGFRDDT
jgi:2-(3-amino-3-carboxypropyl)histidine synthase